MSARRKPAKRRAEKPVDGETRRARSRTKVSAEMPPASQVRRAAKAGDPNAAVEPRPAPLPSLRGAEGIHTMLRNMLGLVEREMVVPARRAELLRELSTEIERVADAHDPTTERAKEATERYYSHLSRLVTGALWVDDTETGINADQALMRLAACQAKALLIAASEAGNVPHSDMWSPDLEFSQEELIVCLGGLTALLRSGPEIIKRMRHNGVFKSSFQQTGAEAES